MAFSAGPSNSPSSEINVTPLIDVLLVLLIIFMVIVPAIPRGLDSAVPQKHDEPQAQAAPVTVRLLAAGLHDRVEYRVGDRAVSYAELRPAMAPLFAARQDRTLLVKADRALTYQRVAEVVGEAKLAGAGAVVLAGEPTR